MPIYTIGHSTRPIAVFIGLLQRYGVRHLADVRSLPRSRFNPQYNRGALQTALEEAGIVYVFMGDELGGRPKDPSVYAADGRIDYALLAATDYFGRGIDRLRSAVQRGLAIAVMCSEAKPEECHRGKLIGPVLERQGIEVSHIDETGRARTTRAGVRRRPAER